MHSHIYVVATMMSSTTPPFSAPTIYIGSGFFCHVYLHTLHLHDEITFPCAVKIARVDDKRKMKLRLRIPEKDGDDGVWIVLTMGAFLKREHRYLVRARSELGALWGVDVYPPARAYQNCAHIAMEVLPLTIQDYANAYTGSSNLLRTQCVMYQLVYTLVLLHNAQICHADIKADNCGVQPWFLLSRRSSCKITVPKQIKMTFGANKPGAVVVVVDMTQLGVVKLLDYGCAFDIPEGERGELARKQDYDALETMLFTYSKTLYSNLKTHYRRLVHFIRLERASHLQGLVKVDAVPM